MAAHTARVFPFTRTIEVSPGQQVAPRLPVEIESVAICDWQPAGDGTYRPIVRIHAKWLRMGEQAIARAGLGVSYTTLGRLIRAGFVDGRQISPKVFIFNLQSWFDHVDACRDSEFWTPERIAKYKESL